MNTPSLPIFISTSCSSNNSIEINWNLSIVLSVAGCLAPYPVLSAKLGSFHEPCLLAHERVHIFPSALHIHKHRLIPPVGSLRHFWLTTAVSKICKPLLLCDLCSLLLLCPCCPFWPHTVSVLWTGSLLLHLMSVLSLILRVPGVEILALHGRLNGTENTISSEIWSLYFHS